MIFQHFIFTFSIIFFTSYNFSLATFNKNIFANNKILHYVQMSRIFKDGVDFLNLKSKFPSQIVEKAFNVLLNITDFNPSKIQILKFVEENFENSNNPKKCKVFDWKEKPTFINDIYDYNLRIWAHDLNLLWKELGRKVTDDVLINNDLYTSIYIPHPFIIPGGRFKELYYWDSFWIIDGIILSEMLITAQNMIRNFIYLVDMFGYVPNGNRQYYLERSQPPLLIQMVDLYFKATGNKTFLEESVSSLEKEFLFWVKNRSVIITHGGLTYQVFNYNVNTTSPRAESYYEDYVIGSKLSNASRAEFYSAVKSATESGWDFSSRWFLSGENRTNNLLDIHTNYLAPVCLNSILGYNAKTLANFYSILGNRQKYKVYQDFADRINLTISRLFWDDDEGMWFDYNLHTNKLQKGFYLSSLVPLWAETFGMEREPEYLSKRVMQYLNRQNFHKFSGGVPTSLRNSSQQWDYPNGWAPLQYFVVLGLRKLGPYNSKAEDLAFEIAQKWILNCYKTYTNSTPHAMFEKYDVIRTGYPGGGGEYKVQQGFGWTNGVALKFLSLYPHSIRVMEHHDPTAIIVGAMLCIVAILAVINYIITIKRIQKK